MRMIVGRRKWKENLILRKAKSENEIFIENQQETVKLNMILQSIQLLITLERKYILDPSGNLRSCQNWNIY